MVSEVKKKRKSVISAIFKTTIVVASVSAAAYAAYTIAVMSQWEKQLSEEG